MILDNDKNKVFNGTPEEIVAKYHASVHPIGQRESDQAYMDSVAERISFPIGSEIRTDSAKNFLSDVAEAGMVDILEA